MHLSRHSNLKELRAERALRVHGEIGLSLEMLRAIVAQLGGEVEIAAVFKNRRVLLDT